MRKQIQEDAEIAEKSESSEIAASSSDPVPLDVRENDFVFLDLKIGHIFAGRIVIELFKHIAPRTCENFRQLCCKAPGTGSSGKPLWYKNTLIHKIYPGFMIQGGDVTNYDGSGGHSIYGPTFEDETFEVKLEPGILGMVSKGAKDTNSSQFFISCVHLPHLEGSLVAFGKICKGFKLVEEISNIPIIDDVLTKKVVIVDCGQLPSDPSKWNYAENDGLDQYPPYPEDWEINQEVSSDHWRKAVSKAVANIKDCGNRYFSSRKYEMALLKYNKALRYLTWIKNASEDVYQDCTDLLLACLSNMAATNINCQDYRPAHQLCSQVLELKPDAKAYFRRGQANFGLHNFNAALKDLEKARVLEPKNRKISSEILTVTNAIKRYKTEEIERCANMLK